MAKKQAEIDNIANWEDVADEMPDIPDLVKEYREILDDIGVLEDRKKQIAPQLEAACIMGGKKSLACGGFKITRVEQTRSNVKPERVIEKACGLGLTASQATELLEYATVSSTSSYPLVTRVTEDVTRDE